jgi:hypothetical protein
MKTRRTLPERLQAQRLQNVLSSGELLADASRRDVMTRHSALIGLLSSTVVALHAGCESGASHGPSGENASDVTAIRPFDKCDPGGPCPDLALDAPKLKSSIVIETRIIDPRSCSINEGTIEGGGRRRLLRFTTGAKNIGTGDLFLGDPSKGDSKFFEFAECHGHFHFKGYADYRLLNADHSEAVKGHKMSFCIEDNIPPANSHEGNANLLPRPDEVAQGMPAAADHWTPAMRTYCHHPGLHRGWTDAYGNQTEGNWIDITGVAPGRYILSVTINPEHMIAELNFENNHAEIPIAIPPQSVDGKACEPQTDAIFRCTSPKERTRCFKGVTVTQTCPSGTKCLQPEETSHPGKCFTDTPVPAPPPSDTEQDDLSSSEPSDPGVVQ